MSWQGWENYKPDTYVPEGMEAQAKSSKYRAKAVTVDGLRFDSKREAARWQTLKAREASGEIDKLSRQVKLPLNVRRDGIDHGIGWYIADFVYRENGQMVLEDAKGVRTELYRWKRRHVEAQYGITIRET